MKKIERNKTDASGVQSGGQKTLFDFFDRKTGSNTPIEKVACPACSTQVAKSKINFHLDHECKSNVKNKKGKRSAASNKKNRNGKDVKTKARKRALLLSGSEDEFDDDMSALDMKNVSAADSCDSDSNSFYLSSSMVEVLLSEESTDTVLQPSSQNPPHSSHVEATSPYFSPDSKKIQRSPGKRQEKVISYDLPSSSHSTISKLLSDWASPEKVARKPQTESPKSSAVNGSINSPLTKSGKAVKAMLDEDWNTSTPKKSPKKFLNKNLESGLEDFEENSFIPGSPKSLSARKRSSWSVTSKVTKTHRNGVELPPQSASGGEDSCDLSTVTSNNSLPVQQESDNFVDKQPQKKPTSKKIPDEVEELNGHNTTHELSPGSDSTDLVSPELVTPIRSSSPDDSSPSPPKANSAHVKKLFPPDSSELDPKRSNGCISSELQTTVKTLPKSIPHDQSSQDNLFDALSMSSSQVKRPYRSPRKFHQGLKKTGLLEHSSQAVSNISPRKKTRSLSPRVSSTPDKLDGSQPSPSKSIEGDQQRYDQANFRNYKGYYLENFLRILDTVMGEPQDVKLFNDEDLAYVSTFRALTLPAQKLYVRLFQRKIKWNKVSKIEYKDICDAEDTKLYVNELIYAGFLHGGKNILCLYYSNSKVINVKVVSICKLDVLIWYILVGKVQRRVRIEE